MTLLEQQLYEALKYAKRFLGRDYVDMDYIDEAIAEYERQLEQEQPRAPY